MLEPKMACNLIVEIAIFFLELSLMIKVRTRTSDTIFSHKWKMELKTVELRQINGVLIDGSTFKLTL